MAARLTKLQRTMMMCLMILVAQVGFAEERDGTTLKYNFSAYDNNFTFTEGTIVKNSLGETMTLIQDNIFQATGTRFAVRNNNNQITGTNKWYVHGNGANYATNRGLYCHFGSAEYLSIMGLAKGQKITITWANLQGEDRKILLRSNNVENLSVNSEVVSGTKYTISKSGSLDLEVGRYTSITSVVIDDGLTASKENSGSISFETSGKTGDHSYNSGPSYPYYKSQLSARNFVEPAISVYPSTANVTYTVENYGESTRAGEKSVAVMNENPAKKDDVLFKNIGWCKVTATITVNQTTYSDSYVVWIWDNVATYTLEDDGTKYRLNGAGVLENRVVTAVPGMTMTFGIPFNYPANGDYVNSIIGNGNSNYTTDNSNYNYQPNSVVVASVTNVEEEHFVSFIPADNGWWDRYPYRSDRFPYQGTFYTFTAKASGVLTVGGYRSANNDVIWKNRNTLADGTILKDDQEDNLVIAESKEIPMNAGQIYIIHGVTPHITGNDYWNTTTGWAVFELEWFKFESNFKIVDPDNANVEKLYGVASGSGATSVTSREKITITGISDISGAVAVKEGSISWKGTITGASVTINSDGTMTFSNITYNTSEDNKKGGAIKVTIKNGENEIDFVMTIPYGKHVWDFRTYDHQNGSNPAKRKGDHAYTYETLHTMMTNSGTDWSRVFKVATKVNGAWDQLVNPIMAARSSINGNNAFYMDNTTGLVFVTGSESFGSSEVSNNVEDYASLTPDQQHNQPYTIITGTDLLWMKGTATIYFPGVTAGQYIKIYTYRHANDKGETYKAKNLVDLDGVAYDGTTTFIMRGMWEERAPGFVGDNIKGCAIFRVPSNYTPTQIFANIPQLTMCDDGWVKIYRIEIMDEFEPDLIMTDDNSNNIFYPVDYDGQYGSVVIRKRGNTLTPTTRNYLATTGQTQCQHANTCDYEVIAPDGAVTVNRTIWNSNGGVNYNRLSLTFNNAGRVRIVQRERANTAGYATSTDAPSASLGYVIDKNEYYINVGELTVQNYPYTWDFTNHNMYQGSSATKTRLGANDSHWVKINNDNNIYQQQAHSNVSFGTGDGQIPQNLTVPYSYFAQGAQLSNAAGTAIAETEGLGITSPTKTKTLTYFATVDNTFGKQTRTYEGYDLEHSAITIDGSTLTGVGTITIPEVNNGMYIFVKASSEPTVKVGETTLTKLTGNDDIFSVAEDVYLYKQTVSGNQDVEVAFANGTNVETVAVTNIEKSINALGYATESRDHAIDYTYQDMLTTHPVKAYAITTYGGEGDTYNYRGYPEVRKSQPLTVVPANTGIVLCQENYSANAAFSSPLFYPAVNVVPTESDNAILETNWMAPNVESKQHYSETICKYYAMAGATGGTGENGAHQASEHSGQDCLWCTKFIMTRKYYTYKKKDGTSTEHDESTNVEAFYRLKIDATDGSHNVIAANKAYLLIPTARLPKALWDNGDGTGTAGKAPAGVIYMDLADITGEDDETTAIDYIIREEGEATNGQDVYYSLSGVRIIGTPTTKGIYIKNGKKVSIK